MRAAISVIIPTLDAEETLPACLSALMEGLDAGLIRELIVSDGGSKDGTCAIAEAWGGEMVRGPASRGGQLRRGCAAAQGAWLLVLHADTVLSPGWSGAVEQHMRRQKAGWFRLQFDEASAAAWMVAGWANLRSRFGLPYGDQGMLLPRPLYEAVGGYRDQPLMEDVALSRALRGQLQPVGAVAVTSAQRYQRQGWLRRGTRNLWTLLQYLAGVSPDRLARAYRR
ncbi:glycosyl transferase [Sulfitobacter sp. SK012]|uniref:TIGR04283 family arsenosugar biosynthesis glycosyltransferase n=1 Tax=Sulfitobacter sp. SK012 TaxID=1389005 RepID=UPI000E0C9975|nr:TIGR04283 family arsenosugar biosynthesis glycosyltransferase [Sulfitobacter sp. SK012]AXI45860.1 glycosyl transferase [Sulfitobacter sp. SK012]